MLPDCPRISVPLECCQIGEGFRRLLNVARLVKNYLPLECSQIGQVRVRVTLRLTVSQYVLVLSPISENWPEFTFSLKFHLDSYRFVIL
jgi:hypothetical protein